MGTVGWCILPIKMSGEMAVYTYHWHAYMLCRTMLQTATEWYESGKQFSCSQSSIYNSSAVNVHLRAKGVADQK